VVAPFTIQMTTQTMLHKVRAFNPIQIYFLVNGQHGVKRW